MLLKVTVGIFRSQATELSQVELIFNNQLLPLGLNHTLSLLSKFMLYICSGTFEFIDFSDSKASAYSAGDSGSIPGSGRSPGEGNGNSLQYFCLENPMDGEAWQATIHGFEKSQTRLNDFTFLSQQVKCTYEYQPAKNLIKFRILMQLSKKLM